MKICERENINSLTRVEREEKENENNEKLVDLESGLGFLILILD